MLPSIIDSAEPFFFQGGLVGCLLIHGFTGAPKEMRQMGEYLAEKGYTVLGVRLAGHATSPRNMLRTTWQDWFFSVSDGWHMLESAGKSIFVVGLSMGGVLSLTLASHFPVKGVIAMSSPYSLPDDPRLPFIRPLSLLVRNVGKGESDWKNPELAKDHVDYPYYPTRSIAELRDLIAVMRERL
ncbi:MAG: alpha/beta fold hydrolase, partial [Chloroflexi bacterium]